MKGYRQQGSTLYVAQHQFVLPIIGPASQ